MRRSRWFILLSFMVLSNTAEAQVSGRAVFTGKGNCFSCHGTDAKGTAAAPNLTDREWLNIDGSLAAIKRIVQNGVAQPKKHPGAMPAKGGADLTQAEIDAVAAYVYRLSRS